MLTATWEITQHENNKVVIKYKVDNTEYTTKLENVNPSMSEAILKQAVEVAVKSHFKRHRFVGVAGSVDLSQLDTDDDQDKKEEGDIDGAR